MKDSKNLAENQPLPQADVSGSFLCFLCENTYNRVGNPCMHYDEDEMDEGSEVSLCDDCAKKTMDKAKIENIQGLSVRFFNCH